MIGDLLLRSDSAGSGSGDSTISAWDHLMKEAKSLSSAHEREIQRSKRTYLWVGLVLFCGTVATAAVATIPAFDIGAHGFDKWDAMLGLAIAITKASLVAAIFMHLNHERRWVYFAFGIGLVHAVGLFVGTYMHYADTPIDKYFYRAHEQRDAAADYPLAEGPVSAPRSAPAVR